MAKSIEELLRELEQQVEENEEKLPDVDEAIQERHMNPEPDIDLTQNLPSQVQNQLNGLNTPNPAPTPSTKSAQDEEIEPEPKKEEETKSEGKDSMDFQMGEVGTNKGPNFKQALAKVRNFFKNAAAPDQQTMDEGLQNITRKSLDGITKLFQKKDDEKKDETKDEKTLPNPTDPSQPIDPSDQAQLNNMATAQDEIQTDREEEEAARQESAPPQGLAAMQENANDDSLLSIFKGLDNMPTPNEQQVLQDLDENITNTPEPKPEMSDEQNLEDSTSTAPTPGMNMS